MNMEITIAEIKENLANKRGWAERAIVVLWERQTPTEQATESTGHSNGRGFNAIDAPLLSSFAKQIQRGRHLTEKQLAWAHKKLPKYARQVKEEIEIKAKKQEVAA
jgi:hypothetical protein